MEEKISREAFLDAKFKEWKKQLKKYLPDKDYELMLEDIFNQVKELLC